MSIDFAPLTERDKEDLKRMRSSDTRIAIMMLEDELQHHLDERKKARKIRKRIDGLQESLINNGGFFA